jgi:hypothetical protein
LLEGKPKLSPTEGKMVKVIPILLEDIIDFLFVSVPL